MVYPQPMPRKNPETAMQDYISSTFEKLGVEVRFEADADLPKLRKGKVLLLGELQAFSNNTPVFVRYKQYGEGGYRINEAMRISKDSDKSWLLEDGSSFVAEFTPNSKQDRDPCVDECCGKGVMHLFHVVLGG